MAGDAFTAVFPGELPDDQTLATAVQRAVTAAVKIQDGLQAMPDRDTPYGIFTVAAKIGIAAGEVKWTIWRSEDGRRAAYSFSGAAIDGCATAEHHASQGEIILVPIAYQLLPAVATAEPLADHWCLTASPLSPPFSALHPPEPARPSLKTPFFPSDLITQSRTGEFRPIFSLFLGLPGGLEMQALAAFIHCLFALQEQYGGLLNRVDFGDKGCHLLLFWGAPVSHENDLARVLTFLLELRRQSPLAFRAGLTSVLLALPSARSTPVTAVASIWRFVS